MIYPIVVPQAPFRDRFGNPNALVEMNPSMFIKPDGQTTLLVRRVDYRKFCNKQFLLYNHASHSSYIVLTGRIQDGIDTFDMQDIHIDFGMPSYPTYWYGLEDIRFIDANTILVTVPECNPSGQPRIYKATLDGRRIHSFVVCSPSVIEKNWMPFTDLDGNTKVVYSVYPLRIKDVETETYDDWESHEDLRDYHGSTNGITYGATRLFLIHVNQDRTRHRWLVLNLKTRSIWYSDPFTVFRHSYIEFPLSLCEWHGKLLVSMGVNDERAFIVAVDRSGIPLDTDHPQTYCQDISEICPWG
jgi:hypothetical protein